MPRRLDMAVVAAGLAPTRSRARDLIRRGFIQLDGVAVLKAGASVAADARLSLSENAPAFVSRGGEKLSAALDFFGFEVAGRTALDVGASTGGFTDVLLRRGALRIYAVDVGRGQLDVSLKGDPRVVSLEETDARSISTELVPETVGAITADVSFVSATKVLGPALGRAADGAWLVVLVKPQFEVGPEHVGKGGVVRDKTAQCAAVDAVRTWVEEQAGWHVTGVTGSPIAGGNGNREFLLGALRDAR